MLGLDERILITGGYGMVGTSICNKLVDLGYKYLLRPSSRELDLTNQEVVSRYFNNNRPDVVIMAAAKVGGIQDNIEHPADYITTNAMMEINTIHNAYKYGTSKLMMICSSSIYPANIIEPTEEDLMNGNLEESNEGYSMAKLFGTQVCKMYKKQYNLDYMCVIPCNLYGPHDRFIGNKAHVVPAMISKFQNAIDTKKEYVKVWGSGNASRELMYVEDFAACCVELISKYESLPLIINIGSGNYVSIKDLANMIKRITNYSGDIIFDSSKPEGKFLRKMSLRKMKSLGLTAPTRLYDGLENTYNFFLENRINLR